MDSIGPIRFWTPGSFLRPRTENKLSGSFLYRSFHFFRFFFFKKKVPCKGEKRTSGTFRFHVSFHGSDRGWKQETFHTCRARCISSILNLSLNRSGPSTSISLVHRSIVDLKISFSIRTSTENHPNLLLFLLTRYDRFAIFSKGSFQNRLFTTIFIVRSDTIVSTKTIQFALHGAILHLDPFTPTSGYHGTKEREREEKQK